MSISLLLSSAQMVIALSYFISAADTPEDAIPYLLKGILFALLGIYIGLWEAVSQLRKIASK